MTVIDNADEHRYEVVVDGQLAHLRYVQRGDRLVLVHTEVPDTLGGRGIGGELVQAAVESAIARDLTVVALCPFAASWLHKHPETAAKVRIEWPGE